MAALAALGVVRDARADASTDAAKVFEEAGIAAGKKDWTTCVAKAEAAWGIFQHGQIRGLQGKCEVELGKYREGATHIAFYEKTSTSGIEPDFAEALTRAREHVEELTITNPKNGATVTVDGVDLGAAPVTLFLDPGKHAVEVKWAGETAKRDVDAVAGTKITLDVPFADVPVVPPSPRPLWPVGLGYGLAAVGLGVGIGTLVAANAEPEFKCSGPPCQAGVDFEERRATLSNASLWTFVAGGTFAVATTGYLIWAVTGGRGKATTASVVVLPTASATSGGLSALGTF